MASRLLLPAILVVVVAATACSPAPTSPPSGAPPSPAGSPQPLATPIAGPGALEISGSVRRPCIEPPSGCGYGVTLVIPGGPAYYARLGAAGPDVPLLPQPGLPASLPEGSYSLVFEAIEYSDQVTFDTAGNQATMPPIPAIACTETFSIGPEPATVRVRVVFNRSSCKVRIRPAAATR